MVKYNQYPHVIYLKQLVQGKGQVAFAVLVCQVRATEAKGVTLHSSIVSLCV